MAEDVKDQMRALDASEIGSTGLNRSGGYVIEDVIKQLRGRKKWTTLREMRDTDYIVGGMLFAVEMAARSVSWKTAPFSDDSEDVANAEFVDEVRGDMSSSWENFVSEALSMLPYGFSLHEIVWKRRGGYTNDGKTRSKYTDGLIGIRKLPIRSQETIQEWKFGDDGGIEAAIQQAPPKQQRVIIPIEKCLLFRTTSHKGNPEGRSILTNAVRPWYLKKNIENIEAIGVERDLTGIPVAWVPPGYLTESASPAEKAILESVKEIVANVKRDEQEGLVFPLAHDDKGNKLFDFTLLTTGGKRQFDIDAIVARYSLAILICALSDFIMLGHEKVGTKELSGDKKELFLLALKAWVDEIQEVFNRHLVPRLFALNGKPLDRLPRLQHGDVGKADLGALGDFIQKISAAGMPLFPDAELENWVRERASLPERPESFDALPAPGEEPPAPELDDEEDAGS